MNKPIDFRGMTADTIGRDLLQALVLEMKLLPDVFQKLSKNKQDDVIDRLRSRVADNIRMAVHMLAAEGRTVVAGDLDQITIKDGVKAVIKFGAGAPNLHELYEVSGKAVLVVVANAGDHLGGMDEVKGEVDQRGLDLGHEYHDNDGGGMDKGPDDIIEGEIKELPSVDEAIANEERAAAFNAGYEAAADGKSKNECPNLGSELVIEWLNGWQSWHDENDLPNNAA
ncbi:MAG: cell division protein FtsK [Pseudomonadota bacterium]|nr:cell division protein FtsK [Pseudomonadota bacterium]